MKLVRRPGVCDWLGARHLRSGVRATLVERGVDTSEEGLIRGAGPIGLGFPQRGLGETGKSSITTVKHHRVNCGLHSCFTLLQFIFLELNCLLV